METFLLTVTGTLTVLGLIKNIIGREAMFAGFTFLSEHIYFKRFFMTLNFILVLFALVYGMLLFYKLHTFQDYTIIFSLFLGLLLPLASGYLFYKSDELIREIEKNKRKGKKSSKKKKK